MTLKLKAMNKITDIFSKQLIIGILLLILSLHAYGQITYPVQVYTQLRTPYTPYLPSYYMGINEKLKVTLINADMQLPSVTVYLKMKIKSSSFTIETPAEVFTGHIELLAGVPVSLSLNDLAVYFRQENMRISGARNKFLRTNMLPDNFYQFNFEVYEANTNRQLSNPRLGFAQAMIASGEPPILNLPLTGATIVESNIPSIMFSWTPRHMNSVVSAYGTEYEFTLVEIYDKQVAPEGAFDYSRVLYTETIRSSSFIHTAAQPLLIPSMRYAWRVRAVAREGVEEANIFKNNGYSPVSWFDYAADCKTVQTCGAIYENGKVTISWLDVGAMEYTVEYRKKGSNKWHTATVAADACTIYNLQYGQEYEYRIGTRCVANDAFQYNEVQGFRVPAREEKGPNCGILPDINLSNQTPTRELQSGLPILVGDFPVFVTKMSGSGRFTGEGYVGIPYLQGAQITVKFENIVVNTDNRLISGFIETRYDITNNNLLWDVDQTLTGGKGVGDIRTGEEKAAFTVDYTINPDIKAKPTNPDGTVDNIAEGEDYTLTKGENGKYTFYLTDSDGNTQKVEADNIPVTIADKTGSTYEVNEKGEVKQISSKSSITLDDKTKFVQDTTIVAVHFEKTANTRYELDVYQKVYSKVPEYEREYKIGDTEAIRVSAKLMLPNTSDEIFVRTEPKQDSFDPAKVHFITENRTEYKAEYKNGGWIVNLVAPPANDGQLVYAVYEKPDGKYSTLAILKVLTYEPKEVNVMLVPVNKKAGAHGIDGETIQREVNAIYNKFGVTVNIKVSDKEFNYNPIDGNTFQVDGTGLFETRTEDMKALEADFMLTSEYNNETVYLFVMDKESNMQGVKGDMPRDSKMGYLFPTYDYKVIAHEIGHGVFLLKHPYAKGIMTGQFEKGALVDNLMDDPIGTRLAKLQWDALHAPGIVIGWFEKDEDGMAKAGVIAFMKEDITNPVHLQFLELDCKRFACSRKGVIEIKESHLNRIKSVQLDENGFLVSVTDIDGNIFKPSYGIVESKDLDSNGKEVIKELKHSNRLVRFDDLNALKDSDLPNGVSREERVMVNARNLTVYKGINDNSEYAIPVKSSLFEEGVKIAIINNAGNPICHTLTKEDCENGVIKRPYIPFSLINDDKESFTFITPSGSHINLPKEISDVQFYYNLSKFEDVEIVTGTLKSFMINGIIYEARTTSGSFEGYYSSSGIWEKQIDVSPNGYIMALPDTYDYVLYKFSTGCADKPLSEYSPSQTNDIVNEIDFPLDVFNQNKPSEREEIYVEAGSPQSIRISDLEKEHVKRREILAIYKIAQIKGLYPELYSKFEKNYKVEEDKNNLKGYYLDKLKALKEYCAIERQNLSESISELIRKYDETYNSNSLYTSDSSLSSWRSNLCSKIKALTSNDLVDLSVEERGKLLSIFVKHGALVFEEYENSIIKVIESTPVNQIDALHSSLMANSLYDKSFSYPNPPSKSLIKRIIKGTDDSFLWNNDNYKALCLAITKQCYQSEDFKNKLDPEKSGKDILVINHSYRPLYETFIFNGSYPETDPDLHKFSASINDKGTISLSHQFVIGWTEHANTYSDGAITISTGTTSYYPQWSETSKYDLSPFDPVFYLNNTDLSILSDIGSDKMPIPVPAIMVLYADDKAFNQTASDVTMATIDVVSIATGTAAITKGIRGAYLAWTIADITNSGVNLAANASGLAKDPEISRLLNVYNLATFGTAGGRITAQMFRNFKAIDPALAHKIINNVNSNTFNVASYTAEELSQYRKLMLRLQQMAQKRGDLPSVVQNCTKAITKLDDAVRGGYSSWTRINSWLATIEDAALKNNIESILKNWDSDLLKLLNDIPVRNPNFLSQIKANPQLLNYFEEGSRIIKNKTPNLKAVELDMYAVDRARLPDERIIDLNNSYHINTTRKNLVDMNTNVQSGKIRDVNGNTLATDNINGEGLMYVIDEHNNIYIGGRGGKISYSHPTLIGGNNPNVKCAGMIRFKDGRILEINRNSGHFKPSDTALKEAEEIFKQKFNENSFDKEFKVNYDL